MTTATVGMRTRSKAGTMTPRQKASSQNATTKSMPKNIPMACPKRSQGLLWGNANVAKWTAGATNARTPADTVKANVPQRHSRREGQKVTMLPSQPRMTKNDRNVT